MLKHYFIVPIFLIYMLLQTTIAIPVAMKSNVPETIKNELENLRQLIRYELLYVPVAIPKKKKLEKILHEGGHRKKIDQILAIKKLNKNNLEDLIHLIKHEGKLLNSKIRRSIKLLNDNITRRLTKTLGSILSPEMFQKKIKTSLIDSEKMIKREHQIFKHLINKLEIFEITKTAA